MILSRVYRNGTLDRDNMANIYDLCVEVRLKAS